MASLCSLLLASPTPLANRPDRGCRWDQPGIGRAVLGPAARPAGLTRLSVLGWAVSLLLMPSNLAASSPPAPALPSLQWTRLTDRPDPVGLKGMYGGATGGHIVLAGGSNFPRPARDGGVKTYHRTLWVQAAAEAGRAAWTAAPTQLPTGLAEGAAVTTPHGIVAIGGRGADGPVDTVFLMEWQGPTAGVRLRPLPRLPSPRAHASAVWHADRLYVAGGEDAAGGQQEFLVLDLAAALATPATASWTPLPPWPGPRRFGASLTVTRIGDRDQLLLVGGKIGTPGPPSARDYLADAYAYEPAKQRWRSLAPPPRPALVAAGLPLDATHTAIAGGSDGHDIERLAELGERYRIPDDIFIYDARQNRWFAGGRMPIGLTGATLVALDSGWILAGGEYSPGLRTPQVYHVR